jgi:hypothetical protein
MADLPGILKELKDLREQHFFQSMNNNPYSIDPILEVNVRLGDAWSESCPSLDLSPNSFESLDFLQDLQPVDVPYPINSSVCAHSPARTALVRRVRKLKELLYDLGIQMNAKLANGSAAIEVPSVDQASPIPTSYHFTSWRDMTGYSCFWSMIILTNKVMLQLIRPFDPMTYGLQSENRSIAFEICKTWQDAWASKPIGALHTGLSFVVAYEYCEPDVQEWIIRGMNSLLDYQMVDAFRWSDEVIAMMSGKLSGEGPGLSFSNVQSSKDPI